MHFICTAGGITTINECVAIYNSYKIDKLIGTASKDSLGVKATLDFDINESNIINFKSVKKFNALAPGKVRYKTIAEDGHLDLIWNGNSLQIQNLKNYFSNTYSYYVETSDGTVYFSKKALSELLSIVEKTHSHAIDYKKEEAFVRATEVLAGVNEAWNEFPNLYQKIEIFSQKYAYQVFVSLNKLNIFEVHFYKEWIEKSGSSEMVVLLQTDLNSNPPGITMQDKFSVANPLPKFDALVHLVATSSKWRDFDSACRTYAGILSSVKKEAQSQCIITYGYHIEEKWSYVDCLKKFVECLKERYSDPIAFGSFVYYLIYLDIIPIPPQYKRTPYHLTFEYSYKKVRNDIEPYAKKFFENIEMIQLEKELSAPSNHPEICIEDFDLMSGQEFELAIANIFKKMGYQTSMTPVTGDQGIDIIAVKNGTRIGIQTKCYTGKVGNSAVQEVVAGKQYYSVNRCMVITNSTFTPSAVKLAAANNVILWDRKILEEKVYSYNFENE